MQVLQGDAVWEAGDDGRWSRELAGAALELVQKLQEGGMEEVPPLRHPQLRSMVTKMREESTKAKLGLYHPRITRGGCGDHDHHHAGVSEPKVVQRSQMSHPLEHGHRR